MYFRITPPRARGKSSVSHFWSESESEVTQSCPTLCNPMDCSLPGSSVHGIFQTKILEWVAIAFTRRSSWPRDWTWVSHIVGRRFTVWATGKSFLIWGCWQFSWFPWSPSLHHENGQNGREEVSHYCWGHTSSLPVAWWLWPLKKSIGRSHPSLVQCLGTRLCENTL